jgi:hypothetical protein
VVRQKEFKEVVPTMTTKLNQRVIVNVPETGVQSQVKKQVETDQEFSATVQGKTAIEIYEDATNTKFKALGQLIMVSLTSRMENLSQSK